jgi:two-component system chemotaxis response regulator CheY
MSSLNLRLHILVIDDQEASRTLARFCLEELGFTDIHEAEDGRTALEHVAESWKKGHPVQLILCDYNMPGVTGFQFFRVLHQEPEFKKIPVLIVSAQQDIQMVKEMAMQGIRWYITKPVTAPVLKEKLELALGPQS